MTVVDHLKGQSPENLTLEVAFGRHVITGDLAKSHVSGTVVTVQQIFGEAFGRGWSGIVGAWFRGVNRPAAKYKFFPGIQSPGDGDTVQGIDTIFDRDTPHSNTAWLRLECPSGAEVGIPDPDTKTNPPDGTTAIVDCQLGDVYDSAGEVDSEDVLLTNPADVLGFGCKVIRRYPDTRVDWAALADLRAFCDELITPDWTTLPQGVGLTGAYFDGSAFDTLVRTRVDPIVEFPLSSGAPELGLSATNYSVRWEGFLRAEYSETYTFQVVHNEGAKLWVDGSLVVDQWATSGTHTGTIALTAGEFVEIKLEFKNASGDSEIRLQWSSTTQPLETIPQDRLYPTNDDVKRFECHAAFTAPTSFDDFLRQVLFSCNGTYQDASGALRFIAIEASEPSFDFDETTIVKNTFRFGPRYSQQELLSLPNRFTASGRDLDSRYIKEFDPPVSVELSELQDVAGRVNEETVVVGNSRRWQTILNLQHYAKLRTSNVICEFEGMPATLPVLPGDLVRVTHTLAGWTNKRFLVLEATDRSIDRAPDHRIFKLLEWPSEAVAEVVTVGGLAVTVGGIDVTVGGD